MLAKALVSLLPPLSHEEKLAVTKIHSLIGVSTEDISTITRPFRSPHHTASRTSLVGGGSKPHPGDISLAHLGVLFLDEIPEYPRSILESIRQPLEDKKIVVSRANGHASYPADFMLVATMNPCPCGYFGDATKECSCSSTQILSYQKRLSGPLLDRIDMVIEVSRVSNDSLMNKKTSTLEHHFKAIGEIEKATRAQFDRYKSSVKNNGNLSTKELQVTTLLSTEARQLLTTAAERLQLSARSYFKIIRVARTIADLEGSVDISTPHISEALQYRQKT